MQLSRVISHRGSRLGVCYGKESIGTVNLETTDTRDLEIFSVPL